VTYALISIIVVMAYFWYDSLKFYKDQAKELKRRHEGLWVGNVCIKEPKEGHE
jgi:hypothetical protein